MKIAGFEAGGLAIFIKAPTFLKRIFEIYYISVEEILLRLNEAPLF